MNIEQYLDKIYAAAQVSEADEFQIECDYIGSQKWTLLQGKIATKSNTENQTIAVKLKKDGKIGRCLSRNFKESAIPLIIESAMENALIKDNSEEEFFYDGKGLYALAEQHRSLPEVASLENPVKFMQEVESKILAADKRILSDPKIFFMIAERSKFIKNSLGLNLHKKEERVSASAFISAQDGKYKETAYEDIYFDKKEDFDTTTLAKKVVKKVLSHLNGVKPTSGRKRVVFSEECFAQILVYLGWKVFAEEVEKKNSIFAEKIGELVASPIVTIIEDPLLKGGYETTSFDDEGVPTYKKEIISRGVLQTYLHNLKTAHKNKIAPTGNASSEGWGVALHNLYLQAGDVSKEELLMAVGDGIYIDNIQGFMQGIWKNSAGDFSSSASGFLIENGNITQPLEQFTIAGNYGQMLKDIKLVANDLEFQSFGIGSPTVWVDSLMIGGK